MDFQTPLSMAAAPGIPAARAHFLPPPCALQRSLASIQGGQRTFRRFRMSGRLLGRLVSLGDPQVGH